MKIIKIKDHDGLIYHIKDDAICAWFYNNKGFTGITCNNGWNYTLEGNYVDKIDRAMLNTKGDKFFINGGQDNVKSDR